MPTYSTIGDLSTALAALDQDDLPVFIDNRQPTALSSYIEVMPDRIDLLTTEVDW